MDRFHRETRKYYCNLGDSGEYLDIGSKTFHICTLTLKEAYRDVAEGRDDGIRARQSLIENRH